MSDGGNRISEDDFKRLIRAVGDEIERRVPKLMTDMLEKIGLDTSSPESRAKIRGSFEFLFGMKVGAETMKRGAMKRIGDAIAGAMLAVLAAIVGLGAWGGKPPLH